VAERQCAVKLTRRFIAAPAEVWAAMTEPRSLARWLLEGRIELEEGGEVELGAVSGRVRVVEPERVLELDWRYGSEPPSVVRFELAPDAGGTRLVLDHRLIAEPVGMAYLSRWTATLDALERVLGGGR
jgi:uncharacterized protein YndB with AHSA1/START domain